jgi:hypothetical protein
MVNNMFTDPPDDPRQPYTTVEITWLEWIVLLRVRKGWSKADLSKACGISRTWLWRALECKPEDPRHVVLTPEQKTKIMTALLEQQVEAVAS